ncbi:MAG: helix-turn-helix domain-containing protein [Melioribacteraceae bacterium]|nr:helix-turn-helix domain-containing protein [Melioribacteraceae bacterium]
MKHISILVPVGTVIIDTIIASYTLLRMANAHYKRIKGLSEDYFEIELVGINTNPVQYNELFQVKPTRSIHEIDKTDLIIVTAISGNLEQEIERNKEFIPWITKQRIENDAEIASLCKGAFILAETGLLHGKSCATHWTVHDQFKFRYPDVNLLPEKIISEDNGIYSSGGAYSFLNFLLYLIEKYCGRETAIWCSKVSEIEFDRNEQGYFMIFKGQKEHNDASIKDAQDFIENNFEKKLNIDDIADMVNISKRNFLRRFKKATSNTPLEYIQRVKIEAAKRKLESSVLNIQEVMYATGYNDEKSFRNIFRKYTGLSPLEYRKKYNREMVLV